MEFLIALILNIILFVVLNIWLLAIWALIISVVLVWGGFLVVVGDVDIFD